MLRPRSAGPTRNNQTMQSRTPNVCSPYFSSVFSDAANDLCRYHQLNALLRASKTSYKFCIKLVEEMKLR